MFSDRWAVSPSGGNGQASAPASTSDQTNFLGQPVRTGNIQFVDGYGYRRIKGQDANGNPIYQNLTPDERQMQGGQYSFAREDAELDRRRSGAAQAELRERDARQSAREQQQWQQTFGLQQSQLQGTLEQIRQQGAHQAGQLQLATQTLQQQGVENAANRALTREEGAATRAQQSEQFNATMAQQTEQMRLNNELLAKRLGMEDRHFERQVALDERNARRTKVLGALTLISQSLSRL